MMALTIRRGDSERLKAVITPYTGAVGLRFMAKKSRRDANANAIIDKTIGSGIVVTVVGDITTPAEAMITIDPEDTEGLPNRKEPPVKLFFDLVDDDDHTLASDELIVEPEVLTGA